MTTRTIRMAALAAGLLVLPFTGAAAAATHAPAPAAAGDLRAAPYYMPLDNDPQDIAEAIESSGQRDYIFAFVLAPDEGSCTPTWDGKADQEVATDTAVQAKADAVRAAGGDLSVSFGGYNGIELGAACADSAALADAYQQVIDKYELTHIDLDVEGDDLGDVAGETKRFEAIKTLKERNPELHVTLTLPMTTVGLNEAGKAEIQRAKDIGAEIDLFKIMDFDYGGPGDDMANSAISVAEAFHGQLRELHPEYDDAAAYARTGVILMNGHTDQPSELFTPDTFRALLDYANEHQIGRFSYWALNRDRVCTEEGGWADGKCSSIEQAPYEFTKILAEYQ
ncbi:MULTISPECIES: chitinase [unclassified Saccharopolyspora]|uniref:chitinase n=1 Tax=unclassified Saccharopolyspora TaxID=2646250 RepID=UPI001CD4BBC4|nr:MULTISPECIES: chitinase [unclassified Saccharopolyspora]MCA1187943.1 chitinase [Saccharopolyspora sp. 6T]MCA1194937.1 chitinase [Saccharopolyspora sp. 6V]MCA1226378.1 chitinase [Saccharopolyspora sp. 6M]MCA1279129.1 chitinase [Saccharopolyspora sp. 7B]